MVDKKRIIGAMEGFGLQEGDATWDDTEDGLVATLGRWRVITEDDERGLWDGDEGLVTAQIVGAAQYGNMRVCFTFTSDDLDPMSGPEIVPFDDVEQIS